MFKIAKNISVGSFLKKFRALQSTQGEFGIDIGINKTKNRPITNKVMIGLKL